MSPVPHLNYDVILEICQSIAELQNILPLVKLLSVSEEEWQYHEGVFKQADAVVRLMRLPQTLSCVVRKSLSPASIILTGCPTVSSR